MIETGPTTLTLTDFLMARITEDEALAIAASSDVEDDDGVWSVSEWEFMAERVEGRGITIYDEGGHDVDQARHIARHDPARVRAECEAKRQIVGEHPLHDAGLPNVPAMWCCATCGSDDGAGGLVGEWPCPTLRALALPYDDHADYLREWRP